MSSNTVVTASDQNYAWGVWLLIASMRRWEMTENVLVGTYNWSPGWLEDIRKFPGVSTVELSAADKRCVTCSKPNILLHTKSEFATWVDCDGIFSGNCSDVLTGSPEEIYLRPRTPSETRELYRRERPVNDPSDCVPANILEIWRRDVGERQEPARRYGCSAALISIHRRHLPFVEKWQQQMLRVLPSDVAIVDQNSIGYFQTDESVLNSLLLFADDAPPITGNYRADLLERPHYIHFAFNPKPWQMWNPHSLKFYDAVLEIVEWAYAQGYIPQEKLPYTFSRKNETFCRLIAPLARNVSRFKKLKRKFLG